MAYIDEMIHSYLLQLSSSIPDGLQSTHPLYLFNKLMQEPSSHLNWSLCRRQDSFYIRCVVTIDNFITT